MTLDTSGETLVPELNKPVHTGSAAAGNGGRGLDPSPPPAVPQIVTLSSRSVTRAAIGERSDRVSVTWAKSG